MARQILLTFILGFVSYSYSTAQDAHFSQFYANPTYLNPSLVGMAGNIRTTVAHREQGTDTYKYSTSMFSFDASLGGRSGWGIQIINDSQMNGVLKSVSYAATLGHRIDINRDSKLAFGIQVGAYQKKLDWSSLTFEDQLHQRNGVVVNTQERFGNENVTQADVHVGLSYSSETIYGGLKLSHLNKPKENFSLDSETTIPIKTTVHLGAMLPISGLRNDGQYVSPNVIYEKQAEFDYLHLGLYYGNGIWTAGMWYRLNDAIITSLGVNISKFKIGYSYDFAISGYKTTNDNAHEISIGYQFDVVKKFKVKNKYKGKCPSFQKYLF
ncbi:PorP/SprF family type IX secretion system membrane protein [Fulvivirga lutea]|uniref:PorP/SprF family type IX secretion system membrane protein n=1 Tax=Fulvivirga lutea TaxID=2810512 RepID=A0A975A1V1_9BACT|nr:PorP/SprF family type IX secretion system membrane protein [Fulvivirga lutea]QSE98814.1 PorP/SprF family type IX secretion system membrane protein [Fulvivirga lutea]